DEPDDGERGEHDGQVDVDGLALVVVTGLGEPHPAADKSLGCGVSAPARSALYLRPPAGGRSPAAGLSPVNPARGERSALRYQVSRGLRVVLLGPLIAFRSGAAPATAGYAAPTAGPVTVTSAFTYVPLLGSRDVFPHTGEQY